MTKFTKENLIENNEYLVYHPESLVAGDVVSSAKVGFIARFKHDRATMKSFKTFLIKNFSVEEYFDRYNDDVPPLKIVEEKGYISNNVKKALKRAGLPLTLEGKTALLMSRR
jgi:hypothetical protein